MKKILLIITLCFVVCSCADDKTFVNEKGKTFTAKPYGWANKNDEKIKNVTYDISVGNVVWSVIFSETIVIPVLLTGWYLFEPNSYELLEKDTLFYVKDSIKQ